MKSNNIENKFKKDSTADLVQKRKTSECPKRLKPLLINHIYKQVARKIEGLAQSVLITGGNHLMDRRCKFGQYVSLLINKTFKWKKLSSQSRPPLSPILADKNKCHQGGGRVQGRRGPSSVQMLQLA